MWWLNVKFWLVGQKFNHSQVLVKLWVLVWTWEGVRTEKKSWWLFRYCGKYGVCTHLTGAIYLTFPYREGHGRYVLPDYTHTLNGLEHSVSPHKRGQKDCHNILPQHIGWILSSTIAIYSWFPQILFSENHLVCSFTLRLAAMSWQWLCTTHTSSDGGEFLLFLFFSIGNDNIKSCWGDWGRCDAIDRCKKDQEGKKHFLGKKASIFVIS